MIRRFFAALEREKDAVAAVGPVTSLSAVVTRANGKTEDIGVVALHHPDQRVMRLWRTSRQARGLPVGLIPTSPEQP